MRNLVIGMYLQNEHHTCSKKVFNYVRNDKRCVICVVATFEIRMPHLGKIFVNKQIIICQKGMTEEQFQ